MSVAIAFLFTASSHIAAEDCSTQLPTRTKTTQSAICFFTSTYPDDSHVMNAADRWNNSCGGGEAIPSLNVGGCNGSPVVIDVVYQAGVSTNENKTCGLFQGYLSGGALAGGTLTVYQYGQYLRGAEAGQLFPCNQDAIDTLTHEIGHVLGLANAPESSACFGHIMGQRVGEDRQIYPDDCAQANDLWTTSYEQQETCNRLCWTTCENGVCPPQPVTTTPHSTMTPIVIDLDRNGFHLSGVDDAVTFDIDADGTPNRISWTSADSGDAFLVFDRNGNGNIDDGRELFGNATLLASGVPAPNGYEALIELDEVTFGGDGDSMLTRADAAWELLQVWTDRDHDGLTDAGELASLSAAGVVALQTAYERSNRTDAHGNLFRFRSKATMLNATARPRSAMTYDVFFVER